MKRSIGAGFFVGLMVMGSLAATGCKKDEDPASVPVPTTTAAAPAPEPTPTATASDAPAASGAPTDAPATPQPVATATTPKKAESIDSCCTALKAIQKSGKSAAAKAKAASAAAVCPGIAKLVKDGTTSRSAGLSQIRSALTGFDVPGECR